MHSQHMVHRLSNGNPRPSDSERLYLIRIGTWQAMRTLVSDGATVSVAVVVVRY